MSVEKERLSLTLTKPYMDGLTRLVDEGLFMERQEAIRAALRLFLGVQGIPPFYPEAEA